jgi:hypothetical protein
MALALVGCAAATVMRAVPGATVDLGSSARRGEATVWCNPSNLPSGQGSNVCGQMTVVPPAPYAGYACTFEDHVVIDGSGSDSAQQYLGAAGLQMVWWSSDNDLNRRHKQYYVYWVNVLNQQIPVYGHYLYAGATCGDWHKRIRVWAG